jgi:hypothetical protein
MWLTHDGVLGDGSAATSSPRSKNGEVGAVVHAEEDVDVGTVLARARDDVGADHVDEGKAEQVFVEGARLLAVAAAIGVVVQAADRDEGFVHGRRRARCAS